MIEKTRIQFGSVSIWMVVKKRYRVRVCDIKTLDIQPSKMKLVQVIIFEDIFLKSELAQKLKLINLGIHPSYGAIPYSLYVLWKLS